MTVDLSNREIATLFWLGALVLSVFAWRNTRSSALGVLRALCQRIFLIIFGFAGAYLAGCVWLLSALGLWTWANLKTTIVWALTVGFVSMFDLNRIDEERTYFRKTIRDTLSVTAILIFIAEFYGFPLGVELVLVPFLALVGILQAVAKTKPEHAIVDRFLGNLLALVGFGIFAYSGVQTVEHWGEFATAHTAREFLVPTLLTFLFLPFLYLLSVYTVYERVFTGLAWAIKDEELRRFAKRKALLRFRLNLDLLKRWRRLLMLENPDGRDDIWRSIREVKAIYNRERNPPTVDPSDGWSPYAAMSFLAEEGIEPGDYHRIYDAWQSSSKFLKLNQRGLANSIVYYVNGTELVANELTLELMVHHIELREEADSRFCAIGRVLLSKALGDTAASLLSRSLEDFEADFQGSMIRLKTEEWTINSYRSYERTLTIEHSICNVTAVS